MTHIRAVENAENKIAERRGWLGANHSHANDFLALRAAESPMWYLFSPYYSCPGTFEKVPGSAVLHDGGKWICGLQELGASKRNCIAYSFGSKGDFTFESRVHYIAEQCEIHTFDPTHSTFLVPREVHDYVTYHDSFGIGSDSVVPVAHTLELPSAPFQTKSLLSTMVELKHSQVDILKIDVEGFEWEIIPETKWADTQVGQLLIELHPHYGRKVETASKMQAMFSVLEDAGYYLASLEPVSAFNYGQVECVFINRRWTPEKWLSEEEVRK